MNFHNSFFFFNYQKLQVKVSIILTNINQSFLFWWKWTATLAYTQEARIFMSISLQTHCHALIKYILSDLN